jgi:uncharacterized protein
MQNLKEKYGPWALITGSSSGIGAEFANQLAAQGLNLVLVARREERLKILAARLEEEFPIKVLTVGADLSKPDFIKTINERTSALEIGLLINNAAMMYINNYLDASIEDELKLIDLNIKAPAILTHHFAGKMIQRKKGGIIYVASTLGYMGTPYSSAYAASKAHEVSKGEGLHYEFKSKGVDAMVLSPGLTRTEMTDGLDFSHMPMKLMETEDVVRAALKGLGKKSQVIPGGMNKMMAWMSKRIMSRDMITNMMGKMMKVSVDKAAA